MFFRRGEAATGASASPQPDKHADPSTFSIFTPMLSGNKEEKAADNLIFSISDGEATRGQLLSTLGLCLGLNAIVEQFGIFEGVSCVQTEFYTTVQCQVDESYWMNVRYFKPSEGCEDSDDARFTSLRLLMRKAYHAFRLLYGPHCMETLLEASREEAAYAASSSTQSHEGTPNGSSEARRRRADRKRGAYIYWSEFGQFLFRHATSSAMVNVEANGSFWSVEGTPTQYSLASVLMGFPPIRLQASALDFLAAHGLCTNFAVEHRVDFIVTVGENTILCSSCGRELTEAVMFLMLLFPQAGYFDITPCLSGHEEHALLRDGGDTRCYVESVELDPHSGVSSPRGKQGVRNCGQLCLVGDAALGEDIPQNIAALADALQPHLQETWRRLGTAAIAALSGDLRAINWVDGGGITVGVPLERCCFVLFLCEGEIVPIGGPTFAFQRAPLPFQAKLCGVIAPFVERQCLSLPAAISKSTAPSSLSLATEEWVRCSEEVWIVVRASAGRVLGIILYMMPCFDECISLVNSISAKAFVSPI